MPTGSQILFVIVYTALVCPDLPGILVVMVCALTPLIGDPSRWKIMAAVVAVAVCVSLMGSPVVWTDNPLALGIVMALVPIVSAVAARWTFIRTESKAGAATAAFVAGLLAHTAFLSLAGRMLEIQIDGP